MTITANHSPRWTAAVLLTLLVQTLSRGVLTECICVHSSRTSENQLPNMHMPKAFVAGPNLHPKAFVAEMIMSLLHKQGGYIPRCMCASGLSL